MLKYRADIDGLRAIAVLMVIAFHIGITQIPGGFVGVDVFFVISGYLITSRISEEVENGIFSVLQFYERRVRRIVPLLVVVLMASAAVGIILLYPYYLSSAGKNITAAALSVSNFYYWDSVNYFNDNAQLELLLHTWSLAVEEQFYFIFPFIVIGAYSLTRGRAGLEIIAIASSAVSLALCIYLIQIRKEQDTAFYMPFTRMWEFLIGVIIAEERFLSFRRRITRELATFIGIACIIASAAILGKGWTFPGVTALPTCFGAGLILASGASGDSMISSILSLPIARKVGLISYSLYLWHWPLIVFYKAAKPTEFLHLVDKCIVLAILFPISYLSWRFVEQPLRRIPASQVYVFTVGAASLLGVAITGFLFSATAGLPGRFPAREEAYAAFRGDESPPRAPNCFLSSTKGHGRSVHDIDARCIGPVAGSAPVVLLVGDSHANHLWHGLNRWSGTTVLEVASAGCAPVLSNRHSGDPGCNAFANYLFGDLLRRARPNRVLLSARWQMDNLPSLEETIKYLVKSGHQVVVSGPVPEYDADLPQLLAIAAHRHDPDLPNRHLISGRSEVDSAVASLAAKLGILYLSPYQAMCTKPSRCAQLTSDNVPLQSDSAHLTTAGSDAVVRAILRNKSLAR